MPLIHLAQRIREPDRRLTGDIIGETISTGFVEKNDNGTISFWKGWEGIVYYVIAGYHVDGYQIIITAYPYLHDRDMALASPMWNIHDVNAIAEFNAARDDNRASKWREYMQWNRDQQCTQTTRFPPAKK